MAKGYIVGLITITDPEAYKPYMVQTSEIVNSYGGRYLIRGGDKTVAEGEVSFDRVVVIEFDSIEKARAFYDDANYAETRKIRQNNSVGAILQMVGFDPT